MGLLDFHAKNLLPSVWSPDGNLTVRFGAQLDDQLKRFPETHKVLLIGDTVSHYWQRDSDVDILLMTPEQAIPEARQQAKRVSGYPLVETENRVNFWPVPENFAPEVLAKHFGPVYNVSTGTWHGEHVQDEMELRRVAGVLQYTNWRLWKAKYQEEPFPYDWHIVATAFQRLSEQERDDVLDSVRYRVAQIDRNVTKLLKSQSRDIWRVAEQFDEELFENEELPEDVDRLPRRVALALLHRFRYQDLLDAFVQIDDKLHQHTRVAAPASNKPAESSTTKMLLRRLLQLTEMILQREGGSAAAIDGIYRLFQFVLENNRYVLTDMRRRRIVYRLYRRYYMGQKDE